MGISADFEGKRICLDTSVFIYFIEENARFFNVVLPLFQAIADGKVNAATSEITFLELLVIPFREKDWALAEKYEKILFNNNSLTVYPIKVIQLADCI